MKVISDVRCAVCKMPPASVKVMEDIQGDCKVYDVHCHGQRDVVLVPNKGMIEARAAGKLYRVHAFTGRKVDE